VLEERPLTGLVVAVPEAEPVLAAHRVRLDGSAALGAPAHVTVIFPFVPADEVDENVLDRVAGVVRTMPRFRYAFRRTAWFDDRVLWLAPDDDGRFRELTHRVWREFPDHPPFEGAFDDVVPHLTVGHEHPREVLARAEEEVRTRLPVAGTASEVVLLAQDEPGGRWRRRAAFPLSRP
jgi:2'-5' RNA ligase superfamily